MAMVGAVAVLLSHIAKLPQDDKPCMQPKAAGSLWRGVADCPSTRKWLRRATNQLCSKRQRQMEDCGSMTRAPRSVQRWYWRTILNVSDFPIQPECGGRDPFACPTTDTENTLSCMPKNLIYKSTPNSIHKCLR